LKVLYIFGNKSTAIEISEQLSLLDFEKVLFVIKENNTFVNCICEKDLPVHINIDNDNYYIISMSDMEIREKCNKIAEDFNLKNISVISKTVYIAPTANIGKGVYVAPMTSISSNVNLIGNSVVNYNVTIGHDTTISKNVILNPGARIGGNCFIGEKTLIGANSFVAQGTKVGENVSIDAMTHVFRDIPDNSICTSRTLKVYKKRGN
jgi:acetyltransferase-like isoleucine patch superfamily enzyme